MLEADANQVTNQGENMNIVLTDIQQKNLKRTLKRGIYKELHKRNILSDMQLNILLELNS